jgi:transcriptional regulator with XRE-family HTH domain
VTPEERLGANFRKARENLGLNRKALAAGSGLTEQRVAEIETGVAAIRFEEQATLERVLGMHPWQSQLGISWNAKAMVLSVRLAD